MQPKLEPIGPREALESYSIDRSGDLRTLHRSRLSIFIEWYIEGGDIQNRNDLAGRNIHRYEIWRRQGPGFITEHLEHDTSFALDGRITLHGY